MAEISDHATLRQWLKKSDAAKRAEMLALRPTEVADLVCEYEGLADEARRLSARVAAMRDLLGYSGEFLQAKAEAGDGLTVWCRQRDKLLAALSEDEVQAFRQERAKLVQTIDKLKRELEEQREKLEQQQGKLSEQQGKLQRYADLEPFLQSLGRQPADGDVDWGDASHLDNSADEDRLD